VTALCENGALQLIRGNLPAATSLFRRAADMVVNLDSPRDHAAAVNGLGRCALAAGDAVAAADWLCEALEIYERIDAAAADDVRGALAGLTVAGTADG
jgi:hypothetical protein